MAPSSEMLVIDYLVSLLPLLLSFAIVFCMPASLNSIELRNFRSAVATMQCACGERAGCDIQTHGG